MKRLLIVEDHPDIAVFYQLLFGDRHHSTIAADLATARAEIERTPPDLILLDLGLPDGDGLDLCREVKARLPGIPVVVVTAHCGAEVAAAQSGADGFLSKPVEPDDLDSVVDRLLAAPPRRRDDGRPALVLFAGPEETSATAERRC